MDWGHRLAKAALPIWHTSSSGEEGDFNLLKNDVVSVDNENISF